MDRIIAKQFQCHFYSISHSNFIHNYKINIDGKQHSYRIVYNDKQLLKVQIKYTLT